MKFHHIPVGFVCILKTTHSEEQRVPALKLDEFTIPDDLLDSASIGDFNHLLFRCNDEERDASHGKSGTYKIGTWSLNYAGLMSVVHIL